MDKENPIIIKENGKIINKRMKPNYNTTKHEVAATLHESEEPLQVIEKSNIREVPLKKKNRNSLVKPIFLAVSSAVIIGAVLSVVMFQFLLDVENKGEGDGQGSLPALGQVENNDNNEAKETTNTTAFTLEPLHGFVIQAGLFSELSNAEKLAEHISDIGLTTMIWEKSGQYFVLLGIAESKEKATTVASSLDTGDVEVYVKEWSTTEGEIQVTEVEQAWLQNFKGLWSENIKATDNLTKESWQELQTESVKDSKKLAPLLQHINNDSLSGKLAGQQNMLQLMYEYEKIVVETGN